MTLIECKTRQALHLARVALADYYTMNNVVVELIEQGDFIKAKKLKVRATKLLWKLGSISSDFYREYSLIIPKTQDDLRCKIFAIHTEIELLFNKD